MADANAAYDAGAAPIGPADPGLLEAGPQAYPPPGHGMGAPAQLPPPDVAAQNGGHGVAPPPAGPTVEPGGPFKLYIAGVPKSFTAEDLQPYFDKFGDVMSTVILVEKGGTGLSRGCAFVSFATFSAAQAAIEALHQQITLPGGPYTLIVRFANKPATVPGMTTGLTPDEAEMDRRTVFFTRGPPAITREAIIAAFRPWGETEKINLFPDRATGYSKGCGFVIYRRQEDAQNLMTNSGGEMALPGVQQTLLLSWPDPERRDRFKRKAAGEAAPPELERQVFFAKIPWESTEEDVAAVLAHHGAVESVKLFRVPGSTRHKGCGLATFRDNQSAVDAIEALDGKHKWPSLPDAMVVKWHDRGLQQRRRVEGAFGAPAAEPDIWSAATSVRVGPYDAARAAAEAAVQQQMQQYQYSTDPNAAYSYGPATGYTDPNTGYSYAPQAEATPEPYPQAQQQQQQQQQDWQTQPQAYQDTSSYDQTSQQQWQQQQQPQGYQSTGGYAQPAQQQWQASSAQQPQQWQAPPPQQAQPPFQQWQQGPPPQYGQQYDRQPQQAQYGQAPAQAQYAQGPPPSGPPPLQGGQPLFPIQTMGGPPSTGQQQGYLSHHYS